MTEALPLLLELNAALAFAVLVVLAARRPFRRRFGPRAAYGLWAAVPLTLIAVCLPRVAAGAAAPALAAPPMLAPMLLGLWAVGVVVFAGAMVAAQIRFAALARRGLAGPAVTGVIVPRLVMPADSATRWSPEERAVILAHEHAHLERGDLRLNAAVAVLQALFWCNPLAHVAAARFRLDQELACDATVMAMRRGRRRLYAEALLKAAPSASTPVPFGCGWNDATAQSLETRMSSLALPRHAPGPAAVAAAVGLSLAAATVAWSLQPPSPGKTRAVHPTIVSLRLLPPSASPPHAEP